MAGAPRWPRSGVCVVVLRLTSLPRLADAVVYNEFSSKISATRKTFRPVHARPSSVTLARRALAEDEEEALGKRRQRLMLEGPRLLTHKP